MAEHIWTAGRKVVDLGEKLGLKQEEIAAILGVDRGTVAAYKKRENANPSVDKVLVFQQHVQDVIGRNVRLEWFFDRKAPEELERIGDVDKDPKEAVYDVPYWGEAPCGGWEMPTSSPDTRPIVLTRKQKALLDKQELVVIRAVGFSNAPRIVPGQYILIHRSPQKREGFFTLARNQDQELTLKLLAWNPEEQHLELQSFNKGYGKIKADTVEILGYAIALREDNEDGLSAYVA